MRGPAGPSTTDLSPCAERELPLPTVRSRRRAGRSCVTVVELGLAVVAATQRGGTTVDLHHRFVTCSGHHLGGAPSPSVGRLHRVEEAGPFGRRITTTANMDLSCHVG
jgi:hypothetical protein